MNLTIIPIDEAVYIDGFSFSGLQLSAPSDVHALQWKATKGWVEFVDSDEGVKPQNEPITELPEWALAAIAKRQEAKDVEDATISAALLATQNQPVTTGTQTL
jgi:hypothetical protein